MLSDPDQPSSTSPLRIATYNVHRWVGRGGRRDFERSLRVIQGLEAHVTALQEVCAPILDEACATVDALAQATGQEVISGPTLLDERGDYGNAVLTRLPVREVKRWEISQAGWEPRGALEISLAWGETSLRVLATHLGLNQVERLRQVDQVLEGFGPQRADLEIVLGDLNEWRPWGKLHRRLSRAFNPAGCRRTFPAAWPLLALDRIWYRPAGWRASCAIGRMNPDARFASDHLPLLAEFQPPAF